MDSNKQIKVGAVISYIAIFINIASGLIYTPWMMNTIGKSDYGLYTLAMSLINTFLIDFGLSMATQRYVAKYLAEGNQEAVNKFIGLIYKLYFIISIFLVVVFAGLYLFIDKIYVELTPAELEKFRGLYLIAVIYSVLNFPFIPLNGMLSAYEKFVQLKLADLLHKFIAVALTVAALILGFGVYSLVTVNLISGIVHIVVRLIIIKKSTPIKVDFRYKNSALVKELFGFSVWSFVSSLAIRLFLTLGSQVLGIVSGTAEVAVFGYAVSLESYIYIFVNAVNGFFMSKLSRISKEADEEQKRKNVINLMTSVGRFIMILFGLIVVGFVCLGQEFINLLFGNAYDGSYMCTILICAYGFVAYPQQIANTLVMVENKVKKRAIFAIIAFVVDIVLSVIFGKLWGAFGVSLAICIALVLYTILMNILYAKDLKLDLKTFFVNCHLKLLPGILVSFGVAFAIKFIPLGGWLGFFVKVACICLEYLVVAWFVMLNKNERSNLLKRRK